VCICGDGGVSPRAKVIPVKSFVHKYFIYSLLTTGHDQCASASNDMMFPKGGGVGETHNPQSHKDLQAEAD
jgi:hypothetical protein